MSGIVTSNILDSTGLIKISSVAVGLTFISKQTASSSSTISFTSGIDSPYKEYLFTFKNTHPGTDAGRLQVNFSVDGGSNYNVTKTSTSFRSEHTEADSSGLEYTSGFDLAQSTDFQTLSTPCGNDNDQNCVGTLNLFNPSSTTFVKNFICQTNNYGQGDESSSLFTNGYGNTTSAIDAVQFKMHDGNIDAGDICLYGLTK